MSLEGQMTNVARYYGGHLFTIFTQLNPIQKKIAEKLAGLNDEDFNNLQLFFKRIRTISTQAERSNCKLYVDAE